MCREKTCFACAACLTPIRIMTRTRLVMQPFDFLSTGRIALIKALGYLKIPWATLSRFAGW